MNNFIQLLQRIQIPLNEKEDSVKTFKQIGLSRDMDYVNACIDKLCKLNKEVFSYIEDNIIPKLHYISKAYLGEVFTCGYVTSSIAESTNSMLKSFISGKAQNLLSMRIVANTLQQQAATNEVYLKCRKRHKESDFAIYDLMTKFHISPKIAEAINGSVVKSERLIVNEIEQGYEVIDIKVNEKGEFDHQENYKVINGKCSCKKCAQAGIPCSHIIKILLNLKLQISSELINQRWIENSNSRIDISEIVQVHGHERLRDDIIPSSKINTVSGRYVYLMSQCKEIASLASKSAKDFDKIVKILNTVENDLNRKEEDIIDSKGVKPGRKRSKRIK